MKYILFKILIFTVLLIATKPIIAQPPTCEALAKQRIEIDKNLKVLNIKNIPDFKYCETEAETAKRESWKKSMMKPLDDGLRSFLGNITDAQLNNCEERLQTITNLEIDWLETCYKNFAAAMKANKANSAKMMTLVAPCLQLIAIAQRNSMSDYEKSNIISVEEELTAFFESKMKLQLKEVQENHKYEYATINNILKNEGDAQRLGVGNDDFNEYFERFSKAMTFDLSLGITARNSIRVGGTETYTQYETDNKKLIKIKVQNLFKKDEKAKKQKEMDDNLDKLSPGLKEQVLSDERAMYQDMYNEIGSKIARIIVPNPCDENIPKINISALGRVIETRNKQFLFDLSVYDLIEVPYEAFSITTGKDFETPAKANKIAPANLTLRVYTALSRCGDTLNIGLLAPEVAENGKSGFDYFRPNDACVDGVPIFGDHTDNFSSCGTFPIEAWKDNISPIPLVTCSNINAGFGTMFLDVYPMDIIKEFKHVANRSTTLYFKKLYRAYNYPWNDNTSYKRKKIEPPVMNMVVLKIPLKSGNAKSGNYHVMETIKQTSNGILTTNDIIINANVTHNPQK